MRTAEQRGDIPHFRPERAGASKCRAPSILVSHDYVCVNLTGLLFLFATAPIASIVAYSCTGMIEGT
jgi:hypothetical protein